MTTAPTAPAAVPPTRPAPADAWAVAGSALVAKALGEWAYEELLAPTAAGPGSYRLELPSATYAFRAARDDFDGWRVDPASVRRDGQAATDPVALVLDARETLGLDGPTTAEVVRELTATHAADARLRATARTAAELAGLSYAELEQHLTGHPVLVLNKGRLGFDGADVDRFAPEARRTVRLRWYAVHSSIGTYTAVPGLTQRQLLAQELAVEDLAEFDRALAAAVPDPDAYVLVPVHPYQDETVVRTLFAPYLADGRLVPLGEAGAAYRPVQSVRTLVASGHRDVKTPLLMRNTLVWRGLGAAATSAAPAVTAWLHGLPADPDRLRVLGEVAAVVVRHPALDAVPGVPYRYRELLGAVWREPVHAQLRQGERARSLAALLHVDPDGRAVVAELVDRSGLTPAAWVDELCAALLPGLLEHLVRHAVAFCPHGENTVVVYDSRDVPRRALIKDLAEDVTLLPDRDYPGLPPEADAVLVRWPAPEMAHSLLSALFAGHFRFLAPLLSDHLGLPRAVFWRTVRAHLLAWRNANPDLAADFDALGLLTPRIERIALNREHLTGGGFHDRSERDAAPDVVHGTVPNPVAGAAGGASC